MFTSPPTHRTPKVHLTVRPNPKNEGEAKDISTLISDRLINLTLTDSRGFEADQLDITLDDSDGSLALPSRGAILSLAFGWADEPLIFKGDYTVDEIEHSGTPDTLTIRARSADLRGSFQNRHERSFHQKTIGEIVKKIAEENQLISEVSEIFANKKIDHIDQTNESSINLLTRLAENHDAIATVKNGRLLFIEAGRGKTASGKILPTLSITRQSGDSHRFSIAEGDNYTAVKAYWHNTDTGKRGEVYFDGNTKAKKVFKQAKGRKITRVKRGKAGEPMRNKNGKIMKDKQGNIKTYKKGKILKDSQGNNIKEIIYKEGKLSKKATIELEQTQPMESDSDKIKTLRHTYKTEQTARNAAQRIFRQLKRGAATFSLTLAQGNAELMPERPISVEGFKTEIDSTLWLITQVTHTISADNGFTSQIECELKIEEDQEGKVQEQKDDNHPKSKMTKKSKTKQSNTTKKKTILKSANKKAIQKKQTATWSPTHSLKKYNILILKGI